MQAGEPHQDASVERGGVRAFWETTETASPVRGIQGVAEEAMARLDSMAIRTTIRPTTTASWATPLSWVPRGTVSSSGPATTSRPPAGPSQSWSTNPAASTSRTMARLKGAMRRMARADASALWRTSRRAPASPRQGPSRSGSLGAWPRCPSARRSRHRSTTSWPGSAPPCRSHRARGM